jgi:hypothetical protein
MTFVSIRPCPSHLPVFSLMRRSAATGVLLCVCSVQALTLGNLRGDALVGRRLSVSVPVQLDSGEVASSACPEVEVFFGDARLESSRLRLIWINPEATSQGVLRIDSTVTLDEPVVTVQLRVGCSRPVSRKYVLLAEIPNEPVRPTPVVRDMAAVPESPKTDEAAGGVRATPPMPAAPMSAEKPVRAKRATHGLPPGLPGSMPVFEKSSKSASGNAKPRAEARKSRLTLVPLPEAERGLVLSTALVTTPVEDGTTRVNAHELWRSLNAQPDDLAKQSQRLQALEEQVKSLHALTLKSQKNEAALKIQLTQAQDERFVNPFVGTLLALLLCALGALGFWGYRTRDARLRVDNDWWRGQSQEPSVFSDMGLNGGNAESKKAANAGRDGSFGRTSRSVALDVSLDDSIFDGLKRAENKAAPVATPRPFKSSAPGRTEPDSVLMKSGFFYSSMGARAVNVEELFDIQQQAEFFASLGQHDHAISLLQHHIDGATTTSGLAYLDLLALYHQLGRHSEYDSLRQEFNLLFKAQVPEFDNYQQQGRGLARYVEVMLRVERDWKQPQILDTLRDLVFRYPDASAHADTVHEEAFDVTAYRELMLLFVIAKDLSEHRGADTDGSADPQPDPTHDHQAPAIDLSDFNIIPSQFASVPGPVDLPVDEAAGAAVNSRLGRPPVADPPAPAPVHAKPPVNFPAVDVDLFALESGMVSLASSHSKLPLDFSLPSDPFAQETNASEPPRKPQPASVARSREVEPASRYLDIEKYLHEEQDFLRDLPKKPKSF